MIIESCATIFGVAQLMASPSARPTRRPRAAPKSDLSACHAPPPPPPAESIEVRNDAARRTLKRPRRGSVASDEEVDCAGHKRPRCAIEVQQRPKARSRKVAGNTGTGKQEGLSLRKTQNATTTTTTGQDGNGKGKQIPRSAEKAINGIKHELERLQPAEMDMKDEKRKLRSQEGTRFKSELSAYFPDYDVVIGNEAEETHFLNVNTPIIIVDKNSSLPKPQQPTSPPKKSRIANGTAPEPKYKQFNDSLFDDLYQAQKVDFGFLDKHSKATPQSDPLPASYYNAAHRRAERLEKSIRNSEIGRAQHEKDQVIRLLEGLQGHDWLKVMGVSGITEGKRKDFEPARDHFIKGCQAILEKFKMWREEEKRRKLEKERVLAEATQEEVEAEESDGDPPDYSDVDHAAAMQLHEEAIARSAPHTPKGRAKKRPKIEFEEPPVHPPEKEFKSFYKKPYLRQAALEKRRRSGRSVSAWGQPIPDISEREFDLPEELKEEAATEATARRKRRGRRESVTAKRCELN